MTVMIQQQLVISGVGGQGVLFVTRLLAEAAIRKGLAVLTSETHGMAQRGGTVVSHLKVGDFSSPLIRPGFADGLVVLKAENVAQHGAFLKPGGWLAVNGIVPGEVNGRVNAFEVDADQAALEIGQPRSVNLVLTGYAIAALEKAGLPFFCSGDDIVAVLHDRLESNEKQLTHVLQAFSVGHALVV